MTKPFIQIDDFLRELTDEEYENYQITIAGSPQLNLNLETTQE